ncbi:primase-helicase family protein [Sphingobacterium spiritivorum]|uniref:primase-helicase family protein n=1 Tax=Sphingobacterium spiritivorum TaxID=258 RepID=UPI003DA59349
MKYRITKEQIIQATSGGLDIIRYYITDIDSYAGKNKKFSLRDEKTPSCAIKTLTDGNYVIKDFGDIDSKWMNGIALCQKIENVEFGEAIRIIAERHGIGSSEEIKSMYEPEVSTEDAKPDQPDKEWYFQAQPEVNENHLRIIFSEKVFSYLEYQHRSKKEAEERKEAVLQDLRKILIEQHWHALESYTIIKNRKAITFKATEFYPIFRIEEQTAGGKTFSKIYQPKSKDKGKRFFYHGAFDAQFLHGLMQVKKAHADLIKNAPENDNDEDVTKDVKLPEVIYCTGGSDALNFRALGYQIIYPSSEHFKLTKDVLFDLFRIADSVMTCPDLDYTGQMQNHRLCITEDSDLFLDIRTIELPAALQLRRDQYGRPCKDSRDFLKYYKSSDMRNLVKVALMYRFWDQHIARDRSGKEKLRYGRPQLEYKLSMERVLNFLTKAGFGRRKVNEETMEFIQVDKNLVRVVKPEDIKGYLLNFLRSRFMNEELLNVVHRSPLLSDKSFESLPILNPDFKDYDNGAQYMFFKNITWQISAKGIEQIQNKDVKRMVWESRILQHDVKLLDPMFTVSQSEDGKYSIDIHNQNCLFFRFLIQTSRVHWRIELEENLEDMTSDARLKYLVENKFNIHGANLTEEQRHDQVQHLLNKMYAFGYLMHRHKSQSRPWIVMPMDDTPNKDGGSYGGTGKSIFFYAIRQIRNVLQLDGKNVKLFEDNHVFEQVNSTTDLIYIDDADRNFPMERTFSMTTGDITVNPKGKTRTSIPFQDSPKLGLTTNFSPDDLSPSTLRRILFLGMSNYYHVDKMGLFNETRQPKDDFGKELFTEFTAEEWNLALNFMAQCCQLYLSWPTWIEAPMENIMDRSLTNNMGFNFLAWAEVFFSKESGKLDCFVPTHYALEDYKADSGIKTITSNGFNQKMKLFAQLKKLTLNPKSIQNNESRVIKNHDDIKYDQREKKWIKIDRKKTQSMFYLQTKDTDINDMIYDPTTDILPEVDFPAPAADAKPIDF